MSLLARILIAIIAVLFVAALVGLMKFDIHTPTAPLGANRAGFFHRV